MYLTNFPFSSLLFWTCLPIFTSKQITFTSLHLQISFLHPHSVSFAHRRISFSHLRISHLLSLSLPLSRLHMLNLGHLLSFHQIHALVIMILFAFGLPLSSDDFSCKVLQVTAADSSRNRLQNNMKGRLNVKVWWKDAPESSHMHQRG